MSAKDIYDFLRAQKINFPPGATMALKPDAIVIGNDEASFVLKGITLAGEEIALKTVMETLPALGAAIKQMAEQRQNAAKLESDMLTNREISKKRKALFRK